MTDLIGPAAVVALGMFDGMHIGHQALIIRTVAVAKEEGCVSAVQTFSNHPGEVLGGRVSLLSGPEERARRMKELGVDQVVMEPFTAEYAKLTPEAFVAALLKRWDLRTLVVGFNYTFGCDGQGTPDALRFYGRRYGFETVVMPPSMLMGEPVSSSRIREALLSGDVVLAGKMLGRSYSVSGIVESNRHIGSSIGFPTANLEPGGFRALPKFGVYGTRVWISGQAWQAVTNVGDNPTVGGGKVTVESHLLDFSQELYGREITVEFLFHVREQRRFESLEALQKQIAQDRETVGARFERQDTV